MGRRSSSARLPLGRRRRPMQRRDQMSAPQCTFRGRLGRLLGNRFAGGGGGRVLQTQAKSRLPRARAS